MPRAWRVLILLLILLSAAGLTYYERWRVRDWSRPLRVAIYPVAMDSSVSAYVQGLTAQEYSRIADFLVAEANRWKHPALPTPQIVVQAPLAEPPPLARPATALEAVSYTLKLRWYAFRQTSFFGNLGVIRLFVLYHPPRLDEALPHSLGLSKGLLGIAHVFADSGQRQQNNIVMAHELLHTLGATDKYDRDGHPVHPQGFADFLSESRYPQSRAEIMAGRIPIAPGRSEIPASLDQVVVGYGTAAEIGW